MPLTAIAAGVPHRSGENRNALPGWGVHVPPTRGYGIAKASRSGLRCVVPETLPDTATRGRTADFLTACDDRGGAGWIRPHADHSPQRDTSRAVPDTQPPLVTHNTHT